MDCVKVGQVIKKLRRESGQTQRGIAEKLNISEKTVSKWERGLGCPDVNLLSELAEILQTKIENILDGNVDYRAQNNGSLKRLKFYICPSCGNVITAFDDMAVYCCGRKIPSLQPKKAEGCERLSAEQVENEWYISGGMEMTKDKYVSFVAYITSDKMFFVKLYPEWNLQTRFYMAGRGRLVWGTNKGELFYQLI